MPLCLERLIAEHRIDLHHAKALHRPEVPVRVVHEPQRVQYPVRVPPGVQHLPLIRRIAQAYKENSSVRDSIRGEHNLQGFFKAYLALNSLYLVEPEIELNYGYSDFLMLPDKARYPDIAHSYIMELKYVSPTATDAEVRAKSLEADVQLRKYSVDKVVQRLCAGTQLHLLKVVFRGAETAILEELPTDCG